MIKVFLIACCPGLLGMTAIGQEKRAMIKFERARKIVKIEFEEEPY